MWQEYESEIFVTDQQALDIYEDMKKIYGDALPHPDHHPILFAYYVKLYRYYHQATPTWNIIQESCHLIWSLNTKHFRPKKFWMNTFQTGCQLWHKLTDLSPKKPVSPIGFFYMKLGSPTLRVIMFSPQALPEFPNGLRNLSCRYDYRFWLVDLKPLYYWALLSTSNRTQRWHLNQTLKRG